MQQDDILVFLQIVESGSLTRAARVMERPKASVSHNIKRLEQELGTQLFDRQVGTMTLNAAGQDFLPYAQQILEACARGRDAALQSQNDRAQEIRIAASVEFASNIISTVFLDFAAALGDVRFVAMTYPRDALAELSNQFDCILYLGEPMSPGFQDMQKRKLGSFRYGLYASPAYLQAHGTPAQPEGLQAHKLLVQHEQSQPRAWNFSRGDVTCDLIPDGRLVSNDPWIIKISAIKGQGICYIPDFFAALEMKEGLLVPILPDWTNQIVSLYALFRGYRSGNQPLRMLLDYVSSNVSKIDHYLYSAKA